MMDLKKSSDEIITELFDSINTVNASESDSSDSEDDSKKGNKDERKKLKKSKKKKSKKAKHEEQSKSKRHKKKKKKRKKHKRKQSTTESDSDEEYKKKSKKKINKSKIKDINEETSVDKEQINNAVSNETENQLNVPENISELSAIDNSDTSLIPLPPPIEISVNENLIKTAESDELRNKIDRNVTSLKVADVFVEDLIESGDQKTVKSLINPPDKPKMAIKISDLRNSTVLELAEEQAKLLADLHEEGEIPDSSNSSADSSLFSSALRDNGVGVNSSKNGGRSGFLNRGIIPNQIERKLSEFPIENQISTEKEIFKEKRLNEKVKRKSKDRERSKDHSPHNTKYKKISIDKTISDNSKDKKKSEQERLRDKRRSREKKGARSRSREKRSRSRTKSRGGHRSRSKDRKRSRSRERKRSKSRDKIKSRDSDKYRDGKKCKHEHGEGNKDVAQSKYKHHGDNSLKNEHVTEDIKKVKRSKSKDRKRDRSRSKESLKKKRDRKTPDRRGRSRDRHSKRSRSSRSRSRSKHKSEYFIDKSKLLEIARKNALNMIKQGQVNIGVNSGIPGAVGVSADVNKVAAITAGGKTVDELTDFCKLLSQKEATGQESISSESSSDNENERPFHHPFQLKERPNNIIMNIRNCASLPVKTHQEKTTENAQQLRLQFPVSSGQQHRKTESEWIPVSSTKNEPKAIMPPPTVTKFEPPPLPAEPEREKIIQPQFVPLPPPPPPPVFMEPVHHHTNNYELSNMISERLSEIRHQYEASSQSYQQINCWPGMENQAGLFTGSTGARVLSAAELASGQQAWAKKDQLICAQPVSGGMGMSLLQKMGWKPGEGLGKHSEGSLEPLKLPVKMDKRGLVCAEELPRRHRIFPPPPPKDLPPPVKSLEGKHPVSLLVEYCSRRHFPPPVFTVISEEGPAHKKNFVFKVTVNGIDYQPATPSPNKKQAKSEAATLCLKSLNILPTV